MIASNMSTHDNLVELTKRMADGVPEEVHDDLQGIADMASNEGEAAFADAMQTLSFTTWIKDICDGYKQEKELDKGTPEYNENAKMIREDIQNINNLGHKMGIKGDIIETPENGKEAIVAAKAVYSNFALPHEVGANVDYAKYMQTQELNNQISHSMKRLNGRVAESNMYGTHAKNFWNAMGKAANHQNALSGEFLDGISDTDYYMKQIEDAKSFLEKEQMQSAQGISDTEMGGITHGDKIDFEGDDGKLQSDMSRTIAKALNLVKSERGMLKAGHVDKKRRTLFQSTLKGYMSQLSNQRREIERDNIADMGATADLEKQREEHPEDVTIENEKKYMEMVEKQKNEAPTFTGKDLKDCAKVASIALTAMNASLVASNVAPMSTAMSTLQIARIGKLAYDVHTLTKGSSPDSSTMDQPKYKKKSAGKEKIKEDDAEASEEKTPIGMREALAIKRTAIDFVNRTRTAIKEGLIQFDENALDYDATQNLNESVEKQIGDIINTNSIQDPSAKKKQQSQSLIGLNNTMKMGTGYEIFDKDPQDMSDEELDIYTKAVTVTMYPMKDQQGKYLPNFCNHFAIGEEEMPEAQQEYTDATRDLMIIGQPETALAVSNSQTQLIDLSQQYLDLYDDNTDLSKVEDTTQEDAEIREQAIQQDDVMRNAMDAYKPLCIKAGLMAGAAIYKKHEYNKAWKQSIADRNLQLMCQGTLQQMEKSQRENEMLNHERMYGPHGLLR